MEGEGGGVGGGVQVWCSCLRFTVWLQVLLPYNPWDTGTSRSLMRNATSDAEVQAHVQHACVRACVRARARVCVRVCVWRRVRRVCRPCISC